MYKTYESTHLSFGDLFVVLQRVPGDDFPILLPTAEQSSLRQHDQRADTLIVGLEQNCMLRTTEVG